MASQKNAKNTSGSLLAYSPANGKIGLLFFFISFLLHGLVFASFIYVQEFRPPKVLPPVIQIDLVSFSPEPALPDTPDSPPPVTEKTSTEGFVAKPEIKKKAPPKIEHKKPDISLKTKPKNLRKLIEKKKQEKKKPEKKKPKKEEVKKKEPVKQPAKPVEKEPEKDVVDEDQQRIAEAIRRLEENLKDPPKSKNTGNQKGAHTGHGKGSRPIDLYNVVIGSAIGQNWVFNEMLAKMDQNLEVRILIKILRSGEIRDIIYETKSGNRYLDESVKKAVKKANPLPALPPGFSSYDVGLIFTPRGLK